MTPWRSPTWWIGVGALAVGLFAVIVAGQWELEGRLFPWVIGIPVVAAAALHTVLGFVPGRAMAGDAAPAGGGWRLLGIRLGLFAWVGGLLALIALTGHHVGVPLFLFVFMLRHGEKWWLSAIMALVLAAFVALLLDRVMHIHFPTPYLVQWLG